MIYCPQCGNPNFDDANYCDTCGEPLINAEQYQKMQNAAQMQAVLEAQRQQREAQVYNKAYRKAHKEAKKAARKNAGGNAAGAAATAGVPASPHGAQQAPYGMPNSPQGSQAGFAGAAAAGAAAGAAAAGAPSDFTMYKHGCLAQAWDDITETRGWAAKIVGLGFINMVPVLNFFVPGFAMKWAGQLPADKVEPMPEKIFADGTFVLGFYSFVLSLVIGIVTGLVGGLLGLIPVLGVVLAVAIALFMTMFQTLGLTRISISRSLGSGFDVPKIWKAITASPSRGGFGKLFCATVLPSLIVGAAALFLCGSLLIIFGLNSFTSLVNSLDAAVNYDQQMQSLGGSMLGGSMLDDPFYSDMFDPFGMFSLFPTMTYNPWEVFTSQLMGMVPLFFVIYLVAAFVNALSYVLTLRAASHYVTRYCRDWCVY